MWVVGIFIILIGIAFLMPKQSIAPVSTTATSTMLTLGGKMFTVETVRTAADTEKGLSGHAPLGESGGMLFVFDTPKKYGFWMKDMTFPIDIIWIGADYKITHIEKSLAPSTYPTVYYPESDSLYVLEIASGQSDLLHIQKGDMVIME